MQYLKAFAGALLAFGILDAIWLGVVARDFYAAQLGTLLSPQPNMAVAVVFYVVYLLGIVYLAVRPALAAGTLRSALTHGAALGFVAYATYDLTNYATVAGWPGPMVVVDMAWGTLLTAGATAAGWWAASRG